MKLYLSLFLSVGLASCGYDETPSRHTVQGLSNQEDELSLAPGLEAPVLTKIEAGSQAPILVTFQNKSGVKVNFGVERSVDNGPFAALGKRANIATGALDVYSDAKVEEGHRYTYRINAIDVKTKKASAYSNLLTASLVDMTIPPPATPAIPVPATPPAVPSQPPGGGLAQPCDYASKRTIAVANSTELGTALATAEPGDRITLAPGVYQADYILRRSGTAEEPIVVCGPRTAVIDGGKVTTDGYTLYLDGAHHWILSGFTVTHGTKGIVTDRSSYNKFIGLAVHDTGNEALHLRRHSSYNLIEGNEIYQTGLAGNPKYGEGVYIGSADSNWCDYTGGHADSSNYNTVRSNYIHHTTAENIDIKEGTTGGVIDGNYFDGTGMIIKNGGDSWINVKGNSYTVRNNFGVKAPRDGIQIHEIQRGWGVCSRFTGNVAYDLVPGYAFFVGSGKPRPINHISSNNVFPQTSLGVSNDPLDQSLNGVACDAGPKKVSCR